MCTSLGFTLLRHLPPLEKSYSAPAVGCKKAEKAEGRGSRCTPSNCRRAGVKGHRGLDLLGQQMVEEGGATLREGASEVTSVPVTSSRDCPPSIPRPDITPGLEEAREPREKSGRGFVLPERRRTPAGASACYMLQQKACVVFSEPPYFDMNHNTFFFH